MYDDRLVIPKGIRDRVLNVLHAAHQGRSSMLHRVAQTVFWPGYTADIERGRVGCHACNTIAPQQQVPVEQSKPPTTPFKSIVADFFDLAGVHYLVTVDRLSRWLDITRAAPGSAGSGAKGLIACLRLLFADKGVPNILSSDGSTEFTSTETQAFLDTLKVKHNCHRPTSPSQTDERKSQSNQQRDYSATTARQPGNWTRTGTCSLVSPERPPIL